MAMSMVKVSQKTVVLIAFCLVSPLIIEAFLPERVQSISSPRSSHIEIQDISMRTRVAKVLFVFEEKTTSTDFRERSTNWLIGEQFNVPFAIPIGRADPDWKLVGTNNVTIWHWRLEKTFYLQFHSNGDPFWMFPREVFTMNFSIATNLSRWFTAIVDVPNFSVSINQQQVDYNQSSSPFQLPGCPYLLKVNLSVFHDVEYQFVIAMLYIILGTIIATAPLLFWKRYDIEPSDFFRISSGLLIFTPVFFFTFRNSIAPSYLTTFDVLCFIAAIIHGFLLLGKIAIIKKRAKSSCIK